MTAFLRLAALCLAGAMACAAEKPNIILYLSDDHGVDFAGCYGNKAIRTPHMDRLAREGMRFTRMFAGSPTCSPSRSILYTGLHSARNGCMGNHTQCKPGTKSLPAYLKALGYRVVLANKGHVGPKEVFEFEPLAAALAPNPGQPRRYRAEGLDTAAVDRFLAAHAAQRAGQPLCLILAESGPHVIWEKNNTYDPAALPLSPILVDTPKTRAALANYYQDITTVDRRVGEVIESVKRHGSEGDTLLIYTTDQGPEWPHCKWTLYDTGLRVPFIARWPGKVRPGAVCDAMISLTDVTPTFVDVAGGRTPAGLDGRSFKDVLLGKARTFRERVFGTHTGDGDMNVFPQRCVRDRRFKYILNLKPQNRWTTHFTKVDGIPDSHRDVYATWEAKAAGDPQTARLLETIEQHPAEELYDTETDPYELTNLAGHRGRLAAMRRQLLDWMKQQGDAAARPESPPQRDVRDRGGISTPVPSRARL